jgi:hypothetical protein
MIKIVEKNRSFIFLIFTLFIGSFLIGGMLFYETDSPGGERGPDGGPDGGPEFNKIENKIKELKNKTFDPSCFNSIKTEIDSYYDLGIYQSSSKTYLTTILTSEYSDLVFNQTELFLTSDIGTSNEVLSWLNQLQKITSKTSKIDNYKNQINAYNYYSITLSKKVNNFISPGITGFNEDIYNKLLFEVKNMPNLNVKYKNRHKFNSIKINLNTKLDKFKCEWATGGSC